MLRMVLGLFRKTDVLLVLLLVVSIVFVLYFTEEPYKSYSINISASLAFALVIRTSDFYRSVSRNIRFVNFFGSDVRKNDIHIVYPEFKLDPLVRTEAEKVIQDNQRLFIKSSAEDEVSRVDIPLCAASNDLRALTELSSMFAEVTQVPPPISSDARWDQLLEKSFVSIGFSSNIATLRWLSVADTKIKRCHDDETARYSEYIKITVDVGGGGGKEELTFQSDDTGEIGIVSKLRPDPNRPNIIWFIVAGLGPDATIGASMLLSRKWKRLHKLFGSDDFLLVLRTKQNVFAHSTPLMAIRDGKRVRGMRSL